MANNGSRYHAEIKIEVEGREARINVFADTLVEIFRDLGMIAAQVPGPWQNRAKGEILNAERKAATIEPPSPLKPISTPVCLHCGTADGMELIEFTSKKDGQLKRAWKCQQCNEWHYPNGKK